MKKSLMIGLLFVFGMSMSTGYATDNTTTNNEIGYEVTVEVPTSSTSVMNVTAEPLVFTDTVMYVEIGNVENFVAVAINGKLEVPDKVDTKIDINDTCNRFEKLFKEADTAFSLYEYDKLIDDMKMIRSNSHGMELAEMTYLIDRTSYYRTKKLTKFLKTSNRSKFIDRHRLN